MSKEGTRARFALVVVAFVTLAATASAQTTFLAFDSQPGDWVGAGRSVMYTPADGLIGATLSANQLYVTFDSASEWWDLHLVPPQGQSLSAGVYEGATRWPFQSPQAPGLDFVGVGRGCNKSKGRFVVLEATYSNSGTVEAFAADFEQHCEGGSAALFGSIRINSTIPRSLFLSVNSPSAYEGQAEPHYAVFRVALARPSATPITVSYSTADGDAHAGIDYLPRSGSLTFPPGVVERSVPVLLMSNRTPTSDRAFSLTLSDPSEGVLSFPVGIATIVDDDGAATRVFFDSQTGDYVGQGRTSWFTPLDSSIEASTLSDGSVHINVLSGTFWNLDFAAPQSQPLTPGTYEGARRYPFQSSSEPGLAVYGDGRGCNLLSGRFTVLESAFGADGHPERLAVDFEQHCESSTTALFGSVRVNSTAPIPEPEVVSASDRLSAGADHTCAVTNTGGLMCWGDNADGQLGDGSLVSRTRPTDVQGLSSGVMAVASGAFHTCALLTTGGVKCWGYNGYGALGDGTTTSRMAPVDVVGLPTGVAQISAGLFHTCALTVGGEVMCWGNNLNGQLGDGTTTMRATPVLMSGAGLRATGVAAGGYHSCATFGDVTRCWGANGHGQVGDHTTTERHQPAAVDVWPVRRLSAGLYHTCAATYAGDAKCWGEGGNGQLGLGFMGSRNYPGTVMGLSTGGGSITTGFLHSCATTATGGASCWGSNASGEVGDGTTTQRLAPTAVTGLSTGVLSITAGASHTCARMANGDVKCWGRNEEGQLGDGTTTPHAVPTSVNGGDDGTAPLNAPVVTSPAPGQALIAAGVLFSWAGVAGAGGYELRVFDLDALRTVYLGSVAGGGATSSLVALRAGTYRFAVRACAGGFESSQCGRFGAVSFTVDPVQPSGAPTVTFPSQGATLTSSTHALAWTAVAPHPDGGNLAYEVVLRDVSAGTTALQITVPSPDLSTIFTMRSSTQYEMKVRACHAGCGPFSTPVTFAVSLPPIPVSAPAINQCAVTGGNSLTCDWGAVANADTYQVQVVQPPPAGPGGGALTVAARQVSTTNVTLSIPAGDATVLVAACNGDGCGPNGTAGITALGPNAASPILGTPIAGTVVQGPSVLFTWSRVPGDNGSNTSYRLFVQDLSRQSTALDIHTTSNFYSAFFKAEGARYDALVIANPGLPGQTVGPAVGFNVAGTSATAPTMVSPAHNSTVTQGNVQLGWSPVPGATLYEYFVAVLGDSEATARGVTPGLVVQVPLSGTAGGTVYSAIARACPAAATCAPGSDAGWGPWSNAPGGPGVTNFTVRP